MSKQTRISQYWHPVADLAEIDDRPMRVSVLGKPLVVFRDESGDPVVLNDVCIHRGASLSMGTVTAGSITCPYHGWTYDSTGACIRIPALRPGKSIPRAARVPAYQVAVHCGLVWTALEQPAWPLPPMPRDADKDPAFTGKLWSRQEWQTSAGRVIENELDVAHFPFVHPYLLADPDAPEPLDYEVEQAPYGLWFQTKRFRYSDSSQPDAPGYARYHHMYPFTHHLELVEDSEDGERVTIISAFHQPTEARRTIMWWFLHRNYTANDDDDTEIETFLKILRQDQEIAEAVRPEEIPPSIRDELHLKIADAPSIMFRRWLETVDMMGLAAP